MKKYLILMLIVMVVCLTGLSSCKRSNVKDPDMKDPAGFRIILSGIANPSTLYIPLTEPPVYSDVEVTARHNDGTPAANYKVIFEHDGYGYFQGFKISDFRITNSQGKTGIRYWLPAGAPVKIASQMFIKATLVDDGRVEVPSAEVYDYIAINVIPYQQKSVCIYGTVRDTDGNGIQGIIIELSNNGGVTLTRPSGSYTICVPVGWTGTLSPNSEEGYTFIPNNYTFDTPLVTDQYGIDFYVTGGPQPSLAATPTAFSVVITGATGLTVTIYNSGTDDPIGFNIASGVSWITSLSATSGTTDPNTPFTFTFNVTDNSGNASRTGTITITATDPTVLGSPVTITVSQEGVTP
jgi:hypothetical protein